MKKIFLPAIACVIALAACTKDELNDSIAQGAPTNTTTGGSGPSRTIEFDFNYTFHKNSEGKMWCQTPKSDCMKPRRSSSSSITFDPLLAAIADNTVQSYFNGSTWETELPFFGDEQEIVAGLQDGTLTVTAGSSEGEEFYTIVNASDPTIILLVINDDEA